jgi:hypothetical protein
VLKWSLALPSCVLLRCCPILPHPS